jgi:hypothetical protein
LASSFNSLSNSRFDSYSPSPAVASTAAPANYTASSEELKLADLDVFILPSIAPIVVLPLALTPYFYDLFEFKELILFISTLKRFLFLITMHEPMINKIITAKMI